MGASYSSTIIATGACFESSLTNVISASLGRVSFIISILCSFPRRIKAESNESLTSCPELFVSYAKLKLKTGCFLNLYPYSRPIHVSINSSLLPANSSPSMGITMIYQIDADEKESSDDFL